MQFKENTFSFIVLLVLTALVLYFTNSPIQLLFFTILLILFYRSKNNGFWVLFFFTIIMDIGGFYYNLTNAILSIGSIEISLLLLFSLTAYFKVLSKKRFKLRRNIFRKPLKYWFFYLFFLMLLGFLYFGNEGGGSSGFRYYYLTAFFLPVTILFYSLPKLLHSKEELYVFSKFLFITIVINLIGQFVNIVMGESVAFLYGDTELNFSADKNELVRPVYGAFHSILACSLAYYYFMRKEKRFNKLWLQSVILLSVVSILITATRGWIIAMLVLWVFINFRGFLSLQKKVVTSTLAILFLFGTLYFTNTTFRSQIDKSLDRFATLELILKGDATAGGTNSRLTDRSEKVMELFYKSPIVGNGFSFDAMERNDQHVGNQNILMSGGIIGYLLILYWLCFSFYKLLKAHRSSLKHSFYSNEIIIFPILLFSLFIIHSSSTALFSFLGYVKNPTKMMFIALTFGIFNSVLLINLESRKQSLENKKQNSKRINGNEGA